MRTGEYITSSYSLDRDHPNYERWRHGIESALLRGNLVCDVLANHISLRGAAALDVGCGVGGTSAALARHGVDVIAVDHNPARLEAVGDLPEQIETKLADARDLPFPDDSFEIVILQDVIEHVVEPSAVLCEIRRVLVSGGILFLSTPNKFALSNMLSDPHWGLPCISFLSRASLRKVLLRKRPDDATRNDLAQLLSLRQLMALLLAHGLDYQFQNRTVFAKLLTDPRSVLWSEAHLRLFSFAERHGFLRLIQRLINDKQGIFNNLLNPTWYLICRKTP